MNEVTSRLRSWLHALPGAQYVPLFDCTDGLCVKSSLPASGKRRLCRSPEMEQAIVQLVKSGLERPPWRGLLYVMAWGDRERFRPLYVGKAGRFGKTPGRLSANLENIASDKSKFARWGDGNDYHIGDLSQALYGWQAYRPSTQKYLRWSEVLFLEHTPLRLREATSLLLVPWEEGSCDAYGSACSLETAESQAIDLAIEEFGDIVLNVQGETWRSPGARMPARASGPIRPVHLINSLPSLAQLVGTIGRDSPIGLDVETTMYDQRLCLIQLATTSCTYLIDPLAIPSLDPLRSVLGPEGPVKVIHNAAFERRVLGETGLSLGNTFDTLAASRLLGPLGAKHGLGDVCQRLLGRHIDKSLQKSDWARRPLSRAQIDYAAVDAEVLVDLHRYFLGRRASVGDLLS